MEEGEGYEPFNPDVCAKLYNRIIRIGFHGSRRAEQGDRLVRNWFEAWSGDPNIPQCQQIFPAPFISFLEQIDVVVDSNGRPKVRDIFVHHLQAVPSPGRIMAFGPGSTYMELEDCILLFRNNLYALTDCAGVILDLNDMTVCYLPYLYDLDPNHPENSPWYPMDHLLGRLNAIIDVGKYKARPFREVQHNPGSADKTCWDVIPFNDFILNQSLEAYEALVQAITARLPSSPSGGLQQASSPANEQPRIATQDSLDAQIQGFSRAFLLAASKPASFKFIAPGLTIYDTSYPPTLPRFDPANLDLFISPNAEISVTPAFHDPVILFPAENKEFQAGLWICPDEGWADTVKLVLPYSLPSYPLHNGKRSPRPSSIGLWQQGECPFYVEHSTRLATLLHRWRELVEEGVWTVGENGVEGGIEFYRQAQDPSKADWFRIGDDCFDLSSGDFNWEDDDDDDAN